MKIFKKVSEYIRFTYIINMIPIIRIKTKNRIICGLWKIVYRKWIYNDCSKSSNKVIEVRGWRTALVDRNGNREQITPCFWNLD